MTDKIMIDGVDVSGCEFLQETLGITACHKDFCPCNKGTEREYLCANSPNYYYKQLIRKTAENNELSEGLEDLDEQLQCAQNQYNAVVEQNKSLQQELKRKEEECKELKNLHVDLVGIKECEIRELKQYKQALEEIKGMIQQEICVEECLYDWKKNCPDSDCRYNQILQKCEVLNGV